jgi:hypothetical protein
MMKTTSESALARSTAEFSSNARLTSTTSQNRQTAMPKLHRSLLLNGPEDKKPVDSIF